MSKLETITMYNRNGPVRVNARDREKRIAEGYSERPIGNGGENQSLSKSDLQEMAQDAGYDVEGMKKSELKELLGVG